MDTSAWGQASTPSPAPCSLEPLGRLLLKSAPAMRPILRLRKAKLHRLLCFCRVARKHWFTLPIFFKVSKLHIKTSYSACTRSNEAWLPPALGPVSINIFLFFFFPRAMSPPSPESQDLCLAAQEGAEAVAGAQLGTGLLAGRELQTVADC